jgi:hypothetical protein
LHEARAPLSCGRHETVGSLTINVRDLGAAGLM